MIIMEKRPELQVRPEVKPELRVERKDISFQDLPGGKVLIQIKVGNVGDLPSRPTAVMLQSAPLGAFVPWQPLTRLQAPALEPGETCVLTTEVARPNPTPLGGFDRIPPKRFLQAVLSPEAPLPSAPTGVLKHWMNRWLGNPLDGLPTQVQVPPPTLAPDLGDLLGRRQKYWAGNLNVFIGNQAVERHMAKALRIYPQRTNLAMFCVGMPQNRDAYSFELVGLAPDWKAGLYEVGNLKSFTSVFSGRPLEREYWVESKEGLVVFLVANPPADCQTGQLEVIVTQRSCGKRAFVEFTLDPMAPGKGCYTL